MTKYKKATERLVEDFVNKVFRAIGSAIRPAVLKHLSNKDPEFGKLVNDLEKSREKIDSYLKTKTKGSSLSKVEKSKLSKGEWPFE